MSTGFMSTEPDADQNAAISIPGAPRRYDQEHGSRRIGTLGVSGRDGSSRPRSRQDLVWIVLLKVLLPLAVIGASIITLTVLQLNGTLREFLDSQAMWGMIMVVLILNIVGFAFIYTLIMVWNFIKHDLLRGGDR
jgi:hypothetical protein